MRITADRVALLGSYGLTEHQARAYLALLEYPETTAGQLAKASRLSRTRLYDILADLHAMGLVRIYLDGTRKYRANPLSAYLKQRTEDLRVHIREMESRMDLLDVAFRPPDEDKSRELGPGSTRAVLGRKAVAREIARMLALAREEVIAVASAGGIERTAAYLREAFETHTRPPGARPPKVHLYAPNAPQLSGLLESLDPTLTGGFHPLPFPLHGSAVIVDRKEALFIQAIPDDSATTSGDDFAIATGNPVFMHDYLLFIGHADRSREKTDAGAFAHGPAAATRNADRVSTLD